MFRTRYIGRSQSGGSVIHTQYAPKTLPLCTLRRISHTMSKWFVPINAGAVRYSMTYGML